MLIAQISDIHASSDNDNLARFERALEWLAQVNPDALVVTGDLIDDGWHEGDKHIAAQLRVKT
ncbi:metallophosphoesterase family protein [[Erwinia] mediterraneensis]|uniref:metallophosphoesterase family protein n=1 Tax=[Erwinia] mediterraneensis TaxID=2161819 RepID=UPI00307947A8